MKRINLVQIRLKANSLDMILRANRSSFLEKQIAEAQNDYKKKYGDGLEIVISYTINDLVHVVMSIWQKPNSKPTSMPAYKSSFK